MVLSRREVCVCVCVCSVHSGQNTVMGGGEGERENVEDSLCEAVAETFLLSGIQLKTVMTN